MSKDLLDAVIGTPPPSTVDIWAIVRRRRRRIVLRRTGIAATSVVAASALVVAGLGVASGHGDTGPAGPVQIIVVPFGTLLPNLTAQDLTDAAVQAVATVAPDARWSRLADAVPAGQPEAPLQVVASPTAGANPGALFGGEGPLARAGRTGYFTVSISTNADVFVCTEAMQETCEVGTAPAGGTLATRRGWSPAVSCTVTTGPSVNLSGSVPVVVPNGTVTVCGDAPGTPSDWTVSWGADLALANGLVLEVYAYASKHAEYAPLGPVLSEPEVVAVIDDIASRITS